MGGENPGLLSYQGHGRIESYPMNLNVAYVTGHERGHANSNRLEALAKNQTVEQDISYKLTLTKRGMVAEGVTKQTRTVPIPDGSLGKMQEFSSALSGMDSGAGLNISKVLLKNELSRLKTEQRNPTSTEISQPTPLQTEGQSASAPGESRANKEFIGTPPQILEGKNNQHEVFTRIKELETKLRSEELKLVFAPQGQKQGDKTASDTAGPREDHIDLLRGEELALQSHLSSVTGVPPLESVGYGSSYNYQSVINSIASYNNYSVLNGQREIDPSRLQAKSKFWSVLKDKLTNLQTATNKLSNFSNYINNQTSSYSSNFVQFSTTVQTKPATYQIDVTQRAEFQKVQSDAFANTGSALGLSGTFYVNGSAISVTTSDSLNSIRDKINWGEDLNKNNILNYAEDANGNGILETYVSGGHNGSYVFVNEDSNFNGINDGTEDVNGNNILDGGTKEHGVLAAIENNRLTLTYQGTSNLSEVVFSGGESSNSLLASLGILQQREVATGNTSSLFQYSLKNETVSQDAIFSVNGTSYTKNSNTVSDVVPNTTITIKQPTDVTQTVNINANADAAVNFIKEFIATYNDAMRYMNDGLGRGGNTSGLMRGDQDIIRVRRELIDSVIGGNFPDNKIINQMQSLGITPGNTNEKNISFLAAQNLANNLAENSANGNGAPDFSTSSPAAKAVAVGNFSIFEALSTAKVGSNQDHTLYYDASRLDSAIKANPQNVYDVFNDKNVGFVGLLGGKLGNILDPQSGTIANKQRLAAVHINGNQITNSPDANQHAMKTAQLQKSFARNFLSLYRSYTVHKSFDSLSISV